MEEVAGCMSYMLRLDAFLILGGFNLEVTAKLWVRSVRFYFLIFFSIFFYF